MKTGKIVALFVCLLLMNVVPMTDSVESGEESPLPEGPEEETGNRTIVSGNVYTPDLGSVKDDTSVFLFVNRTAETFPALTFGGVYSIEIEGGILLPGDVIRAWADDGINMGHVAEFTIMEGVYEYELDITLEETLPSQRPGIVEVGLPSDLYADDPITPSSPSTPEPPEEIDAPTPTVLTQTVLLPPPEVPEPYVSFDEQITSREILVEDLGLNTKIPNNNLFTEEKNYFVISLRNTLDSLKENGYGGESSFIVDVEIYDQKPDGTVVFITHIEFGNIKAGMVKTKPFQYMTDIEGEHIFRTILTYGDVEYDYHIGFYVFPHNEDWEGPISITECPTNVTDKNITLKYGDLTIEPGGCLTLRNTTLRIKSEQFEPPLNINVIAGGELKVLDGSLVTALIKTQQYRFLNHGTLHIKSNSEVKWAWGDADPSLPGGIQNFGTLEMDNAIITEPATHGIYTENPVTVTNSVFTRDINSNSFKGHGIYAKGTDNIIVENVVINNAQRDGIHIVNTMAQVRGVTVENAENGIYIEGNTATITGNNFTNNYNGMVFSNAVGNIENNLIEGNTKYGIRLEFAGSSVVRNNQIKNNFDGIVALGVSEPAIEDNILTGNLNNSIHALHGVSPHIKSNTITAAYTGILLEDITNRTSTTQYTLRQLADGEYERTINFGEGGGTHTDWITIPPDASITSVSFNLEGLDPPVEPPAPEEDWELPEPEEEIPTRMEDIDALNAMLNSNPYDVEEGISTEYGSSYRLESYAGGSKSHYTPYPTFYDGENWVIGDLTILPAEVGIYSYEVLENNFDSFFTTGDAPVKYHIRDADYGFTTSVMGLEDVNEYGITTEYIHAQDAAESIDGNRIIYSDIFDNVDLRFDVRAGQIKDIYFIDENLGFDGDLRVDTEVKFASGLSVVADNSVKFGEFTTYGEVSFKDADGITVFRLPPAFAWDASGNVTDAEYVGKVYDGTLKLGIRLPGKWLDHEERVYPVTLDPGQIMERISELTWATGTEYYIVDDAWVAETDTLTIEPGVQVTFNNSYADLAIFGRLEAEGEDGNRIKFTGKPVSGNTGFLYNYIAMYSSENRFKFVELFHMGKTIFGGANGNRIENNVYDCSAGIYLKDSSNNLVANNSINGSYKKALLIERSSWNNILNNDIRNSWQDAYDGYGIILKESDNNTLKDNTFWNNNAFALKFEGLEREMFNHTIDRTNKVNGKNVTYYFGNENEIITEEGAGHITLAWTKDVTLLNSDSKDADPISVYHSEHFTVENCISSGNYMGLYLYKNTGLQFIENLVKSNEFWNNRLFGAESNSERYTHFYNNSVVNNANAGIVIRNGLKVALATNAQTKNYVSGSIRGLMFLYGFGNSATENVIENIGYGIGLTGEKNNLIRWNTVSDFESTGITSARGVTNQIGSNELYKGSGGVGIAVDDVGTMVFHNHIELDSKRGMEVRGKNNLVYNNEIFGNDVAIGISVSGSNHGVYRNNIYNCTSGVLLAPGPYRADGILLWENEIHDNGEAITLMGAKNSRVYRNQVHNNSAGISINDYENLTSEGNYIYNNAFINNSQQADASGTVGINCWNEKYPIGGNYWGKDYTGYDAGNGTTEYHNTIEYAEDAMGDTNLPHGTVFDKHPMMFNYAWLYPGNVTLDIGSDGTIDWAHSGRFFRVESMDDSNGNMSYSTKQAFEDVQTANLAELNVFVPLVFSFETVGKVRISDIVVELTVTDSMIYGNVIDSASVYGIHGISSQVYITNNVITNSLIGARFDQEDGTVFTRNTLTDNVEGINVSTSDSLSIDFNTITGFEKGLVWDSMNSLGAVASHNLIVGSNLAGQIGIFDINSVRGNISGNDVCNNDVGILVENSHNIITGNLIESNKQFGMEIRYGATVEVFDNDILDHKGATGIFVSEALPVITNNRFYSNYNGIFLDRTDFINVSENYFKAGTYGIYVNDTFSGTIYNNTAMVIRGASTAAAVIAVNSDNVSVELNTLGNNTIGIFITSSDNSVIESNYVWEHVSAYSTGIWTEFADNFLIENNHVVKEKTGILFKFDSHGRIKGNIVEESYNYNKPWVRGYYPQPGDPTIEYYAIRGIDGWGPGTCSTAIIENNNISWATGEGIYLNNCGETFVRNNTVEEMDLWGINADGMNHNITAHIVNNTVRKSVFGISAFKNVFETEIVDNLVVDTLRVGIQLYCYNPTGSVYARGNTVINTNGLYKADGTPVWLTSGYGIEILSGRYEHTPNSCPMEITENTIINSEFAGINARATRNSVIQGNDISGNILEEHPGPNAPGIGSGIKVLVGSHPTIENNYIHNNSGAGMWIIQNSNATIKGNTIENNSLYGMAIVSEKLGTIVENNLIRENTIGGIYIVDTVPLEVFDNTILKSTYGIYSENSDGFHYYWNDLGLNDYGLCLENSNSNAIAYNDIEHNEYGVLLGGSSSNAIESNNVMYNAHGVVLNNSDNNVLKDNTVKYNPSEGFGIFSSDGNAVLSNTLDWNINTSYGSGIHLYDNKETIVSGNDIRHSFIGIHSRISDAVISGNRLEENGFGINTRRLDDTSPDVEIIDGNRLYKNIIGMFLYNGEMVVSNNIISGEGFLSDNRGIEAYYMSPELLGNTISHMGVGVRAVGTEATMLINEIRNNNVGILIEPGSVGNMSPLLEMNTLCWNNLGISLYGYEDTTVSTRVRKNNFVENGVGLKGQDIKNAVLFANTFENNELGLFLNNSESNLIYHNNFLINIRHAEDSGGSHNRWNETYPIGGNRWGTTLPIDMYRGPEQDIPGSDDINDYEYNGIGLTDNYPLVRAPSNYKVFNEDAYEYYNTVQSAVDGALPGERLLVLTDRLLENAVIDRSLTLRGIGWESSILDGMGSTAISIQANDVVVKDLMFVNTTATDAPALFAKDVSGLFVQNCYFVENTLGIELDNVMYSNITSNAATGQTLTGIYLNNSRYGKVESNALYVSCNSLNCIDL